MTTLKKLVFAGDSHTAIFRPLTDDVLAIYHRGALTMDSFSRGNSDAYKDLVEFLTSINLKGCALVLCLSEVDIRVHFWRDMPVYESRGMPFGEYLDAKIDSFLARVETLGQLLNLPNIILWGAPASQTTMDNHTEELPATGDSVTRNIITHLFNTRLIQAIATRPTRLQFSTPFYGMVSDDFVTDPTWLHDGVHLNFGLRNHCYQMLQPLVDGSTKATFAAKFHAMRDLGFAYLSQAREQRDLHFSPFFRTWIRSDANAEISLVNSLGKFSLFRRFSEVGTDQTFNELVLRRAP
jgi:hypothetical protein